MLQQQGGGANPQQGMLDTIRDLIVNTITDITIPVANEYAYMLFNVLVAAVFASYGLQIATGKRQFDIEKDITLAIMIGAFGVGIAQSEAILRSFEHFAVQVGIWAAEGNGSRVPQLVDVLHSPSRIIELAFDFGDVVMRYIGQHSGMEVLYNAFSILLLLIAFIVVLLVFTFMAWVVLAAQINFWIAGAFSIMFVPLMLYKPTEQLGKTAFMGVITHGTKFMLIAFMVTLTYSLMVSLVNVSSITFNTAFQIVVISLVLGALTFSAGKLADSILQGAPTLGGGDILGGIVKTGLAGVGLAAGAAGGAALLGKGASSSAKGGSYLAGGANAAAKEAKASGGGRMQQIAAGVKGAATNARSNDSMLANIKERYSAGKQNYQNQQPKKPDTDGGEANKKADNTKSDVKDSPKKEAPTTGGASGSGKANAQPGNENTKASTNESTKTQPENSTGGDNTSAGSGQTPDSAPKTENSSGQADNKQTSKQPGTTSSGTGSSQGNTSQPSDSGSAQGDTKSQQSEPEKPKPNVASRMMDKASSAAYKQQMVDQVNPRDDNPKPVQPPKDSDR